MALNSVGIREDAPGAHRLERAVANRELAEAMIKSREAHMELSPYLLQSFMNARKTLHHFVGLKNLQIDIPNSTLVAETAKASRAMRQADKEYGDAKERSSNLLQSASVAFKQAKKDQIIGEIQRLAGKILFVKSTKKLPILNR